MRTPLKETALLIVIQFTLVSCLSPSSQGEGEIDINSHEEQGIELQSESAVVDSRCDTLSDGQPVGLSCVHCAHQNAHQQAMMLADIMLSSCRRNLAVSYLIDGHFGIDDNFIAHHINVLAEGRTLTAILYLSNGSTQRHRRGFDTQAFDANLGPEQFRELIMHDEGFREAYRGVVRRALQIKSQVTAPVKFIFIPGLEDNLTDEIFYNVLELTREVAGDSVLYGRNPCPNCYSGNGHEIPPGLIEEVHTDSRYHGVTNGIVFTDGRPYVFTHEGPQGHELALSSLLEIKRDAEVQPNIFLLWTAKYQGLGVDRSRVVSTPHPDARDYVMPSAVEYDELVEFLR